MTEVKISPSPLLKRCDLAAGGDAARQLVDHWTAQVLRGRRQIVVHEKRAGHVHLGTCMARPGTDPLGGKYDVSDCDCGGPALAMSLVTTVRGLLNLWTDATRERRIPMIPMVAIALAGLGPELESCPRCSGGPPKHECDRCQGTGVSERKVAE